LEIGCGVEDGLMWSGVKGGKKAVDTLDIFFATTRKVNFLVTCRGIFILTRALRLIHHAPFSSESLSSINSCFASLVCLPFVSGRVSLHQISSKQAVHNSFRPRGSLEVRGNRKSNLRQQLADLPLNAVTMDNSSASNEARLDDGAPKFTLFPRLPIEL
jgi:hypothetical protein